MYEVWLKEYEEEHTSIQIAKSVIRHSLRRRDSANTQGPDRDPRPHRYRQAEITSPFVTGLQRVGFSHPYKTKLIIIYLGIIRQIRP
jgi:hypothetical protein